MDHLATAKALYAAFNAHNIPGILQLLDDNIEWDSFGPDFALAIGFFRGKSGVQDFFAKLVGPETGQQVDLRFQPKQYFAGGGTVHVIGVETGYLTSRVLGGAAANKPFFNNFDHTLWFADSGKITHFRANYNLAQSAPTFWPLTPAQG
jgi:ketosteroid isomerase-like protein